MNEKPLVTIVTVTFNLMKAGREKYFRQCLESVHNQTYKNIEHIIIDGASSDGTVDLIKEYARKGWVRYISEKDSGIYDAMNKGIKMAKGKYIAFLNSDDFYHNKEGVELSVNALESSGADFSYAPVINFDDKNNIKQIVIPKISNVFFTITPCHQTMFVKKDVIIKEGMFNTDFKCVGDYDLTVRLCLKKYKSVFVNNTFLTYRLGGYSFEATRKGIVFNEVSSIYYKEYSKLHNITRKECEEMCGCVYDANYKDVPFSLANKFRYLKPYFDYEEYLREINLTKKKKKFSFDSFFLKRFISRYWYKFLNSPLRQPARKVWFFIRGKKLIK